mmetsp:Transcript_44372/g.71335  ORF Transcript_44372/g.71335 Transcript_44372/m.71335 type:complete len:121 (-) Transcript_44372:73-435(-)
MEIVKSRQNKASGASVLFNTKDNDGKTPAHHAAENGHADSLRVVHNGEGNLSAVDESGCTPCHYAAMNGHECCIGVIVDVRADYRSKNAFGFTPLRLALRNHHASCAAFIRASIRRADSG